MDSMKGSLSALAACEAVRLGVLDVCPGATVRMVPMADGGEGTADVLIGARGGRLIECQAMGPHPDMRVKAGYGWLPDGAEGATAVVEMAAASGLHLLDRTELDPLRTTTFGTGQLLQAAVSRGAGGVWLAAGGSGTVDGGVGAAMALGWRFRDAAGRELELGGGELERIVRIEAPDRASLPSVTVLCDVENPLLGAAGAARVFGPQKGATPEVVERLDHGLSNLADAIERDLGLDVRALPGAGAAGGLAAGAVVFFGARLERGVEVVADAVGLDESLAGSAWVVTGEGRLDRQSLHGKVVSGVVRRAARLGVRVAVIAGRDELGVTVAARHGISALESCVHAVGGDESETDEAEAMERAPELLRAAARRFASGHLRTTP